MLAAVAASVRRSSTAMCTSPRERSLATIPRPTVRSITSPTAESPWLHAITRCSRTRSRWTTSRRNRFEKALVTGRPAPLRNGAPTEDRPPGWHRASPAPAQRKRCLRVQHPRLDRYRADAPEKCILYMLAQGVAAEDLLQ